MFRVCNKIQIQRLCANTELQISYTVDAITRILLDFLTRHTRRTQNQLNQIHKLLLRPYVGKAHQKTSWAGL